MFFFLYKWLFEGETRVKRGSLKPDDGSMFYIYIYILILSNDGSLESFYFINKLILEYFTINSQKAFSEPKHETYFCPR